MNKIPAINLYFIGTLFSKLAQGAYLVVGAWTLTTLSGDIKFTGIWLLTGSITSILIGSLGGTLTDRYPLRWTYSAGELLAVVGVSSLALWLLIVDSVSIFPAITTALFVSAGATLSIPSNYAYMKIFSTDYTSQKLASRVSVIAQVGLASGAGLGGLLTIWFGAVLSLFVITGLFVASLIVVYQIKHSSASLFRKSEIRKSIFTGIFDSFKYTWRDRDVALLVIVLAILNAVGQVTNVLLPGLIALKLGLSSNVYGVSDALWSVGAVIGGILAGYGVVNRLRRFSTNILPALSIAALASVPLAVSGAFTSFVAHFLIGLLFSISKVLADTLLIERVHIEYIGRVRATNQMLVGLLGGFIYSAPTIFNINDASYLYIILSIFLATVLCLANFFRIVPAKSVSL